MIRPFGTNESPTEVYRRLAENLDQMKEWSNENLLLHFLDTRLMIQTDSGMSTNRVRMQYVFEVGRWQHAEILRRMGETK